MNALFWFCMGGFAVAGYFCVVDLRHIRRVNTRLDRLRGQRIAWTHIEELDPGKWGTPSRSEMPPSPAEIGGDDDGFD